MQDEESHSTDEQVKRDEQKDEIELKEQEVPAESHLTDGQIKRDEPVPASTPPPAPSQVVTKPVLQDTPPEPPNPPQASSETAQSGSESDSTTSKQETPSQVVTDEPVLRDTPEQTPSQVVTDEPVLQDTPIAPGKPTQDEPKRPAPASEPEPKSHSTDKQIKRDKLTPEQKAMQLTEEELDAARKLWAKNHLSEAQKKSNESRHKRMLERMDELEKLVKSGDSTLQELSNKMNLSEKLTSGYLQKLVKAGRIKATGNTNNRRFS